MRGSVSITGMGVISPHGAGKEKLWNAALSGQTCIRAGLGVIPDEVRMSVVNRMQFKYGENLRKLHATVPAIAYALGAIEEAMLQANWTELAEDDGVILATTTGLISAWEGPLLNFVHQDPQRQISDEQFSETFYSQSLGLSLSVLMEALRFRGNNTLLLSSACSAATQAIAMASLWVSSGKVRRCLVGGVEVLSALTTEGFRSLQLLSPKMATPFDQNRSGINLSEAAAFLCVERVEHQSNKGLAAISGYGLSTDAYHLASPHPEGKGCVHSIQSALKMAKLTPKEIDWVHAHGTGSRANDSAEGAAIEQVWRQAEAESPWVTSTKAVHGHALGASGALEVVLCVEALVRGTILSTLGLAQPDPLIHVRHPSNHLSMPIHHLLKNTLGFGGNNASLIISAVDSGLRGRR